MIISTNFGQVKTKYKVKMEPINTLIIGASAAGLSCTAHLKKRNIDFNEEQLDAIIGDNSKLKT